MATWVSGLNDDSRLWMGGSGQVVSVDIPCATYPTLLSGMVVSGLHFRGDSLSGNPLDSGLLASGSIAFRNWPEAVTRTCNKCTTVLGGVLSGELKIPSVLVYSDSGQSVIFCFKCAGFDLEQGGFGWQREQGIRETLPQLPNCPAGMLSDFLEQNGSVEAAEYVRKRYAGNLSAESYRDLMSGG